jgi:acyl carrier protein
MSWTSQTLRTELLGILKKYVQGTEHELGDRTELVAHLGLDSLAVMEVVADVEDKFGLTIEDDDLRALVTVGDVATAIETRLQAEGRLDS